MPLFTAVATMVQASLLPVGSTESINLAFAGDSFAISLTEPSATPATERAIIGNVTLNKQGNVSVGSGNGNVAGVRGFATVAAGTTLTGGFIYGTQGKLAIAGTLNNGSGFNAGLFGQLDMSAIVAHTSGYLAPIIADFSTASLLATDAKADMMVLLNTSQCLINSIMQTQAKANFLFDLNDLGQGAYIVATAKGSGWDKSLKIKLNGTTYYIPCNPAAS